MSTYSHKHNTRLKTGVLKRKCLNEHYSDASSNNSSSDSDFDSDYESSSQQDITENNDLIENKILAKDKLQYYQFLNKLFPSNYSKSQINKIKRQRLYNFPKNKKNIYKKYNKSTKSYYNSSDDENIIENQDDYYQNSLLRYEGLKKLFNNDNHNKNINIILNMKDGKNNIINYDTNSSMPNITSDLQLYSLNNLKDKHEHEHEHEHEDEYEDEDEDDDEDEDENEDEDEKRRNNIKIIMKSVILKLIRKIILKNNLLIICNKKKIIL